MASPQGQDAVSSVEPTLPEPGLSYEAKNDASIPSSPPVAGQKRPAPSLLPAFEPLSSSPALPRPLKRQNTGNGTNSTGQASLKYPTPVPTSSTGIMSSSPIRRPPFVRTSTAASEREPLGALPSVDLPENGEVLMMGRSSNSSHYQLSANRLVSRVHVKARYIPSADQLEPGKIEIVCNGWNGLKLHCQGRTWELFKGDTFTSETEGTQIMLDVQDARVMLQWPKRGAEALANLSDSSWDDSPTSLARHQAPGGGQLGLHSSPLRRAARIQSPSSPSLGRLASSERLQALFPSPRREEPSIQIFEDNPEPELPGQEGPMDVGVSMRTEATISFSSDLSDPGSEDENNPDEENDPLVHSFGPFGANISGRFASISTRSPKALRSPRAVRSPVSARRAQGSPIKASRSPRPAIPSEPLTAANPVSPLKSASLETTSREATPSPPARVEIDPAITNHVVNQLAFSRLSSTPLSTIMQKLPADTKVGLTMDVLRTAIENTASIGIIERQGKDAAGKALESEYYYVPEGDGDEQRRTAVVDSLRKPSLRNCRKQHKQYYWKRPRTP